tara:strand:- start:207 stop:395 length:189 start_codon:yes stop_codon:yes gene_type:complete
MEQAVTSHDARDDISDCITGEQRGKFVAASFSTVDISSRFVPRIKTLHARFIRNETRYSRNR